MQKLTRLTVVLSMAAALAAANVVYAESAPVYDADSSQQQFDGNGDQPQDVPPPAPDQDDPTVPGDQAAPTEQQSSDQQDTFMPAQQVAPQAQQTPKREVAPQMQAAAPPAYATENLSVEQRLKRVEQQVNNMQTGESGQRLESLQDQVQTLRGQVEQLAHQVDQIQAQQKAMYNDLDKRVSQTPPVVKTPAIDPSSPVPGYKRKLSGKTDTTIATTVTTTTAKSALDNQPNVAEEQQIYQTAYEQIKSKKYTDAINTLQSMLKKYPAGQFASNAHYWLGELYGIVGKTDEALVEFTTVVQKYPDSPRIADAQLKVGLILASQSKWSDAKSAFKKVINRYPGTASSRLASEQLKQLKQAGH